MARFLPKIPSKIGERAASLFGLLQEAKMTKPEKLPSGSWRIRFMNEFGERVTEVFPERRDADFSLKKQLLRVEEVKRGLRLPAPPSKTFAELCDYWMEKRAAHKRSGDNDGSILRAHFRPIFEGKKISDITVFETDRYRIAKSHLSPKTICNHLTLLISMLNLAKQLRWLHEVPAIKKPSTKMFSRDYQFLRTDQDIESFLAASKMEGENVFALYATAIFTGMRAGELAGLQRSDIDFDRGLITCQRSYDKPTKADEVRYIPILNPLPAVLRNYMMMVGTDYIFPNMNGTRLLPSSRIFQEVLHRVLKRAGLDMLKPRLRFHDLRHTFASHWMMKGGEIYRLQRILGHHSLKMTQRYAHLSPDAFVGDKDRFSTIAIEQKPPGGILRIN